jgi:hypothetical protein
MANGGARPGAGRKPGPTKATIERAILAQRQIVEAEKTGLKLGKEVLAEFMQLFGGLATKFQPDQTTTTAVREWAKSPEYDKFLQFATLARDTAKMLAPYQSPTFRSIELAAPAPEQRQLTTEFTLHIFGDDPRSKVIEGRKVK